MAGVKRWTTILLFLFLTSVFGTEPSTPYILTDFPISLIPSDSAIWIKWAGATRDTSPIPNERFTPDSGRVYYSTSPGGSIIENYTDSVVKRADSIYIVENDTFPVPQNNIFFPGIIPKRGIKFRPCDQNNMDAGIYYLMVAWRIKEGLLDTTFFSNEIKLIVESDSSVKPLAPARADTIEVLTPTFQWKNNPGVPYYHIIVSDEKIDANIDEKTIQGLSIIWEAITANTQLTYGAPDPSGTITADPPPFSPGKTYSWIVLNNYGNHPAYSSIRIGLPWSFTIKPDEDSVAIKPSENIFPAPGSVLNNKDNSTILFQWTHDPSDERINTYKIYLYIATDFEEIDAQMVVWNDEVTAGEFESNVASVSLDASATLTDNKYTWKIITVDKRGAGVSGEVTDFKYEAPTGTLEIRTKEQISVGDSIIDKSVALVEVKVEVLDGSLEAPLLFYTDDNGYLSRERPTGTYRLTVVKEGFESQTRTVTINEDATVKTEFYLKRPDATVFGKVVNKTGDGINLATIIAISDQGDTVTAKSDPLGNFILSCYEADWSITAKKTGYITSLPRDTTVTFGQSVDLVTPITLDKNQFTLSGVVKNDDGYPLIGAKVQLLQEDIVVAEVSSTPQSGSYSFSVEAGTYKLKVTKTGFSSYSSSLDILGSTTKNITIKAGASIITGYIIGRSWNKNAEIYAPITNAIVLLIDTSSTPNDTISTVSDKVYGDFEMSLSGGKKYKMCASAHGYTKDELYTANITGGKTYNINDTLYALAMIKGAISLNTGTTTELSNINVDLLDTSTNEIAVSAYTDALGTFEMRNIPQGDFYISAGREGLVVNSVIQFDIDDSELDKNILSVDSDYRPFTLDQNLDIYFIDSINIVMESGTKTLKWFIDHKGSVLNDASIKVQSPLKKTISPGQSVAGIGAGSYITVIDADHDSIVDCSYHTYTIPVSTQSIHTDTVLLPVMHHEKDTLTMSSGMITFDITVYETALDNGLIYYKDISAKTYKSTAYSDVSVDGNKRTYTFQVQPDKNGNYMIYYFKLAIGKDIYGYEQETYMSYIEPDAHTLTRIAISPSSEDTLLFASEADIDFVFKGYYGSTFLPATQISDANVTWTFVNAAGCRFDPQGTSAEGLKVTVKASVSGSSTDIGILRAEFNETEVYQLAEGVSNTIEIYFKTTEVVLDSIRVSRVDPDERQYITTSPLDKAEFVAEGINEQGEIITISPSWEIYPDSAGTISEGIFKPFDNFLGHVNIYATAGDITGQYNRLKDKDINKSGLDVHYLIPATLDTVNSRIGLKIVIPSNLIDSDEDVELSMDRPVLTNNRLNLLCGDFNIIGDAYDIEVTKGSNVEFNTEDADSIIIIIDVPEDYHEEAIGSTDEFYIAGWNSDSIQWEALSNSVVALDGKTVSIKTTHFSKYALIHKASNIGAQFSIKPNPFSPYVKPEPEYGHDYDDVPEGTCLEVIPSSKNNIDKIKIDIYNIVGDKVWSVILQNAVKDRQYKIWWNGKTTDRTVSLEGYSLQGKDESFLVPGKKMCRNGRYFVILTIDDSREKKMYRKQVILFK